MARALQVRALPFPQGCRPGGVDRRRFALASASLRAAPGAVLLDWSSTAASSSEAGAFETCLSMAATELADRTAAGDPLGLLLTDTWDAACTEPKRPLLMGVLNVTPDSFSDGGRYLAATNALEHGLAMERDGADILDVGGESSRPGASPISAEEELARVLPAIRALREQTQIPISIDTTKAVVAEQALGAGANRVNDISAGLADPAMLPLVARLGAGFVAMHSQGKPPEMQSDPRYVDPVAEVLEHLRERAAACLDAGIDLDQLWLDPGIGFGKALDHNLALLRRLPELRSLGCPLLLGVSRKSFIGHLSGAEKQEDWRTAKRLDQPSKRLGGTAAALVACIQGGAEVLRVHDVAVMAETMTVALALQTTDQASPCC
ncbi:MAG: dihydropteroate synthase [Planctomycetota bacterium]|jgi:dihydropteroate synthase